MEGLPHPYKLEWSETLSVDIPEIDAEHRAFIETVNQLNTVLAARASREEVERIMTALSEDARNHFRHEQRLFQQYGYPQTRQHALIHGQIQRRLLAIAKEFRDAEFDREWIALGLEIKHTLVAHLLEEDMKYKAFLSHALKP